MADPTVPPTHRKRRAPAPAKVNDNAEAPMGALEPCPPPDGKLEVHPGWPASAAETPDALQVIVRVAEEDYVPQGVHVRARVSAVLFTADLASEDLDRLQADPLVVSVGMPRAVHTAD
jgi:hypothetical protein